jgi:hypothetical protein
MTSYFFSVTPGFHYPVSLPKLLGLMTFFNYNEKLTNGKSNALFPRCRYTVVENILETIYCLFPYHEVSDDVTHRLRTRSVSVLTV